MVLSFVTLFVFALCVCEGNASCIQEESNGRTAQEWQVGNGDLFTCKEINVVDGGKILETIVVDGGKILAESNSRSNVSLFHDLTEFDSMWNTSSFHNNSFDPLWNVTYQHNISWRVYCSDNIIGYSCAADGGNNYTLSSCLILLESSQGEMFSPWFRELLGFVFGLLYDRYMRVAATNFVRNFDLASTPFEVVAVIAIITAYVATIALIGSISQSSFYISLCLIFDMLRFVHVPLLCLLRFIRNIFLRIYRWMYIGIHIDLIERGLFVAAHRKFLLVRQPDGEYSLATRHVPNHYTFNKYQFTLVLVVFLAMLSCGRAETVSSIVQVPVYENHCFENSDPYDGGLLYYPDTLFHNLRLTLMLEIFWVKFKTCIAKAVHWVLNLLFCARPSSVEIHSLSPSPTLPWLEREIDRLVRVCFGGVQCVGHEYDRTRDGRYRYKLTVITNHGSRSFYSFSSMSYRHALHKLKIIIDTSFQHVRIQGLLGIYNADLEIKMMKVREFRILRALIILIISARAARDAWGRLFALGVFVDYAASELRIDSKTLAALCDHDLLTTFLMQPRDKPAVPYEEDDVDSAVPADVDIHGINDVHQYVRGFLNSSALSSTVKIVTLIWAVVFINPGKMVDMEFLSTLTAQTKIEKGMSIASALYEHVVTLATCGYEYYHTRDANVFLRNENLYNRFKDRADALLQRAEVLTFSDVLSPEMQSLDGDLHNLILEGISLASTVKATTKTLLMGDVLRLRSARYKVLAVNRACKQRNAPFTILLYGRSGIGKSSITTLLTEYFRKLNPSSRISNPGGEHKELPEQGVYNRNAGEEYWSCYCNSNWCVVYDDIAQKNCKVQNFAEEIQELICVVNNMPFYPNMAALDDKGKTYLAPHLVIASTNNKSLNASQACSDGSAVARRFPYIIIPTVKPAYTDSGGSRLDPAKAVGVRDLWIFNIERVEVDNAKRISYPLIATFNNVPDLLKWYKDAVLKHFKDQNTADGYKQHFDKGLCPICDSFSGMCNCAARASEVVRSIPPSSVVMQFLPQVAMCSILFTLYSVGHGVYRRMFLSPWERLCLLYYVSGNSLYTAIVISIRGMIFGLSRSEVELRYHRACACGYGCASYLRQRFTIFAEESNNPSRLRTIAKIVTGGLVMGLLIYWLSREPTVVSVQGGIAGKPMEPIAPAVGNVWKNNAPIGLGNIMTNQSKTGSPGFLTSALVAQTALLRTESSSIHAFNIKGRIWLIPKHFYLTISSKSSTWQLDRGGSLIDKFSRSSVVVHVCPHADFVALELPLACGRDLTKYLLPSPSGAFSGFLRVRGGVYNVDIAETLDVPLMDDNMEKCGSHGARTYWSATVRDVELENGDCGGILYSDVRGQMFLAGFHCGIQHYKNHLGKIVYNRALTYPFPVSWINTLDTEATASAVICHAGVNMDSERGNLSVTEDIHPKNPIRYEGIGDRAEGISITPVGTIKGAPQQGFSSKVKPSTMAPFWESLGYIASKIRPSCPSWMPRYNCMKSLVDSKEMFDKDKLRKCADHYFARIKRIPVEQILKTTPLDEDSNLFGIDGVDFVDAMNFSKGAGFPYFRSKTSLLCYRRIDYKGQVTIPSFTRARLENFEAMCRDGVRPCFIFNSSLKDEPISEKKNAAGKIRVFQAISFEGLYLIRKFFLSIICLLQHFNLISELAVGMNPHGDDWAVLHRHLFPGPKWKTFCGDYANFDQHQSAMIMLEAWEILIRIAELSPNYSESDIQAMRTIAVDCSFPCVNYFGDLMFLHGSNPSGHALTVIINSIVNSLYIRYAWLEAFGSLDECNDDSLRIETYGDDNVVSVEEKYQDKFNLVAVSKFLGEVGVVYTDAQKSMTLKPFDAPEDYSFLKRAWVDNGIFVAAPLELKSIYNMLLIQKQNVSCDKERDASAILSSLTEMFHHGELMYNKHLSECTQCVQKYELENWISYLTNGTGLDSYSDKVSKRLAVKTRETIAYLG